MKYFIEQWRADFDYIIINSPPMGAVIDAKVLAALANKVIFVVRWRETERQMVAHNLSLISPTLKNLPASRSTWSMEPKFALWRLRASLRALLQEILR